MTTSRRGFVTSALALGSAANLVRSATGPKPNILFIAVDDLNDWIGSLGGHPQTKTPNLDRLAARCVNFTNAHCAAPLCNPSRAALMTGVRPSTSGVYTNNQPFRESTVLKNAVTLPMHLREHGYKAIGSGKIYHDAFADAASWNDFYPSLTKQKPAGAWDTRGERAPLNGIPRTAHFDWGPAEGASDDDMSDGKVAQWITGHLSKKQNDPLFLACGLFRPHLPWYVPKKYFDLFPLDTIVLPKVKNDDLEDVPATGLKFAKPNGDHAAVIEHGQWKKAVQAYLASIAFMDTMVGRVMRALETGPNANDTAVVLWSDHGWHLGEKLHWRKFTLWEEATHNVLMMSVPGLTKPGGRCGRTVSLIDIYPTLNEVTGAPARRELEGTSLMPQLKNPQARREVPAITTYFRGNHSVRTERWRYIKYVDGGEELYDRSKDEMEWTNLAGKPEYAQTKVELAKWLPKVDAPDSPSRRGGEE